MSKADITDFLQLLKVEIWYPIDQVEQAEGSWEEDAGVGVHFGDADVYPAVPPRPRPTILKAAKKTGTVLAIETLVPILLIPFLEVCSIVHLNCGWSGADVNSRCLRWSSKRRKKMAEGETLLLSAGQLGMMVSMCVMFLWGVHGKSLRCSSGKITLSLLKAVASYRLEESRANQSQVNSYGKSASKLNWLNTTGYMKHPGM